MNSLKRKLVVLGSIAVMALAVGVVGPAQAGWMDACENRHHVAYNPLTAGSMAVGHDVELNAVPERLTYAWACVDDGGSPIGPGAATSVGTAGYHWANETGGGYGQHIVTCPNVPQHSCQDYWVGAGISEVAIEPGGGGAQVCASFAVRTECEEVRADVTHSTSAPVTTSTGNPTQGGFCGVDVSGTCTAREAVVTAGGTTVTVTGTGLVPVTEDVPVPVTSICINKYPLLERPVVIQPDSSSC